MKKNKILSAEEIIKMWEQLISIIENNFSGERREKLLKLYNDLSERYIASPASGKVFYHCAYPGGLLEHTLNVINISLQILELYEKNGYKVNFSREELIFTALNHDLGKVGDLENDYYVETEEEWRRKRGELFVHNPNIRFMKVSDRSLWLLQKYGIEMSQTEYLGIILHDGLYEESNAYYLMNKFTEAEQLRDDLPIILHQADMMSMIIEKNKYKNFETTKTKNKKDLNEELKNILKSI